mgnify:FL=1|jgi:ribonuclease HII|tara:strand:- start:5501 stop:6067 length:567 start_codon:yes stop_codon:yes gene_type:complete
MTSQIFAGVDEVGRGCLAGPVVSVAIILKKSIDKGLMVDSKKVSSKKRTELSKYILRHSRSVGIGFCTNHEIDKLNIHNATLKSMQKAIMNLNIDPTMAYIDGMFIPDIDINCESIIGGDAQIPEISAASIIAKVLRDNYMIALDKILPVYRFDKNKGYGTSEHMKAIDLFGPSIYHRYTFAPLSKNI